LVLGEDLGAGGRNFGQEEFSFLVEREQFAVRVETGGLCNDVPLSPGDVAGLRIQRDEEGGASCYDQVTKRL
jgi:hypothetical protein